MLVGRNPFAVQQFAELIAGVHLLLFQSREGGEKSGLKAYLPSVVSKDIGKVILKLVSVKLYCWLLKTPKYKYLLKIKFTLI